MQVSMKFRINKALTTKTFCTACVVKISEIQKRLVFHKHAEICPKQSYSKCVSYLVAGLSYFGKICNLIHLTYTKKKRKAEILSTNLSLE